jgi:hypothetical protein
LKCNAITSAVVALASSTNRGLKAKAMKKWKSNKKGVDKINPLWYNNTKR